jgi:hypothetical protein
MTDPEQHDEVVYTAEQILDRVAVLEKTCATWHGVPDFAATIAMQIWALKLAADVLGAARRLVDDEPFIAVRGWTERQRRAVVMQLCTEMIEHLTAGKHEHRQ